MKKMIFLFLVTALVSCKGRKNLVEPPAYSVFLQKEFTEADHRSASADFSFWKSRVQQEPSNQVYLLQAAYASLRLFSINGQIAHLQAGDSLLRDASAILGNKDPEILYALAQAAIKQHRFPDAVDFSEQGYRAKGDPYIYRLLAFDAAMETGNTRQAGLHLSRIRDKSSFDYLIRKSKWDDHHGDLAKAIESMESAAEKVKGRHKPLYCWTLSNLGDMYGHAGRIEDAYKSYLRVLGEDSSCLHALKGIARIAFSHDRNTEAAKKILRFILRQTASPDTWLQLADIAEWEGNTELKTTCLQQFLQEAGKPEYAGMYNKYLILLYAEEWNDPGTAVRIAEEEIRNRATPESYDWLAWAHFKNGNLEKAVSFCLNYVVGKTGEPETLFRSAMILSADGRKKEAKELLMICRDSAFELGPVVTGKIEAELGSL